MASAGCVGCVLSPVVVRRKKLFLICDWNRKSPSLIVASLSSSSKPSAAAAAAASESNTVQVSSSSSSYSKKKMIEQIDNKRNISQAEKEILEMKEQEEEVRLKDYFSRSEELVISSSSSTTTSSNSTSSFPRWFTPLLQSPPSSSTSSSTDYFKHDDSPILLYLPGIDGVGLGLILQYQTLSKIFDVWCLHIPLKDRTSFTELVKLVESTVRLQHSQAPNRPIYLLGHSFGGCLALAVAARNPHIDLVLILANPATSFNRSLFKPEALLPLSIAMLPDQLISRLPYMLIFLSGAPVKMVTASLGKGLSLQDVIGELSQESVAMSSYLSVLSDHLTEEALLWKVNMLKSAAAYVNSRLHAVKAQTLILTSGNDLLLPSVEEGQRLRKLLPNCEIRTFDDSGHALLLEDEINLASILKGASFYRRGRSRDYVSDYFPPSPSEFEKMYAPHRWLEVATNPVMLSTLESGKIVRGLDGIPSEGPVLFVGYHMMLGFELIPLVSRFWTERNILLRGVGHPMMFRRLGEGQLPDLSNYDTMRCMGAVPVSGANLFKLFKSKSHVLLYPGGMREALHRKGEEYKLFWPEQAEFVRMASRFGATIIPFGSVGEDDVGQLLLDYNDLMKIPYFKNAIRELTEEAVKLRTDATGEVSNQDVHLPILVPKIPGRFYYHFGKPIETKGRIHELKSREKSHELYLEVKSEVEKCLDYLRKKRENDPYRNIVPRLTYQATHGFDTEVPTFDV